MTEPVSYTGDFKQSWAIIAKQIGSQTELRAMQQTFGLADSHEQALARVEKMVRANQEFRQKYRGWQFLAVLVSHSIKINEEGMVNVAKGDRKVVMIR